MCYLHLSRWCHGLHCSDGNPDHLPGSNSAMFEFSSHAVRRSSCWLWDDTQAGLLQFLMTQNLKRYGFTVANFCGYTAFSIQTVHLSQVRPVPKHVFISYSQQVISQPTHTQSVVYVLLMSRAQVWRCTALDWAVMTPQSTDGLKRVWPYRRQEEDTHTHTLLKDSLCWAFSSIWPRLKHHRSCCFQAELLSCVSVLFISQIVAKLFHSCNGLLAKLIATLPVAV